MLAKSKLIVTDMHFAYFDGMLKVKAYIILIALLVFIAYFGVYGFYVMLTNSIGEIWALTGAGVIALGMLIIAVVGVTMIKARPPKSGEARYD